MEEGGGLCKGLVRMLEEHEGGMKGIGRDERGGRLKARGV